MTMRFFLLLSLLTVLIKSSESYAPVVICPGFGNDSIDYDTPLQQPSEVGLRSVLCRRGFDPSSIYTVPVKRSDWIRVAGGLLDIPDFYTGNAKPTGLGYGWYIQRLKETVDLAYEESGGEKVILLAHSAGGWLARAAMADGSWSEGAENDQGNVEIRTSDRVTCLVTMGAIHNVPEDESTCVTRGALKYTAASYPGAFLKDEGIAYVSVGGAAVMGDNSKPSKTEPDSDADELYANRGEGSASRVAFNSYEAVSGRGDLIGDGVVPFEWTQLDGSNQIQLDGVVHSINEAGTTIPTDRWYGSEDVIDRWLPTVLAETGLKKGNGMSNGSNKSPFTSLQEWASNIMSTPSESNSRRDAIKSIASSIAVGAPLLLSQSGANAMYENAPVVDSKPIKLESGVSIQDLRPGDGDIVSEGKRVNIQWALKRSNGYSIDSSSNNDGVPFIFTVGAKSGQRAIAGLDEGIRGMRVGGIRRIVMPPSLTYVEGLNDGQPGPIPPDFGPKQRIRRVIELRMDVPDESFILDVKATRVQ